MQDRKEKLEQMLRQSLKTQKAPSELLQTKVLCAVRNRVGERGGKKFSLWFLPMLFNSVFFLAVFVGIWVFFPYTVVSRVLMALCLYLVAAGILLTVAGLQFADLKEKAIIEVKRKGEGF
ncbi:MAG TPA: hypothetical protein H9662_03175 [Firmicutes bacterium]|nr:hypothetical protein [Bacillota bacterium]